jgi:UDP-glucose 4-epimerase
VNHANDKKVPLLTSKWPEESKEFLELVSTQLEGKSALVTGGASFIGSHLVEALLDSGCKVRVIDDLSSGSRDYLPINHKNLRFEEIDILSDLQFERHLFEVNYVFHLAAIHGGRGFIEAQPLHILRNIGIDNKVFEYSVKARVDRIVYASSACAYNIDQQASQTDLKLLSEYNAGKIMDHNSNPDGTYGWTKLLGEFQLESFVCTQRTTGIAARIFTAYGPRENESHAAIALIAKALLGMNPYKIWGNGMQTRNFTYVSDTVCGLIGAALYEPDEKFDILNVGTDQHSTVLEFTDKIFQILKLEVPEFAFQLDKPAGVASRASNNEKVQKLLGWSPSIKIESGIERTIFWYQNQKNRPRSIEELEQLLEVR